MIRKNIFKFLDRINSKNLLIDKHWFEKIENGVKN